LKHRGKEEAEEKEKPYHGSTQMNADRGKLAIQERNTAGAERRNGRE
jgi:hypothetical protein